MITLKNKQRRMRTFNLDAPFFVKRHGETLYGRPETLTLLALERRENVPDAVLSCTEIKAARDAGTLRVYASPEPTSQPKPEASAPTTVSTPEPASEPKAEAKPLAVETKLEPEPPASEPEPKPVESAKEPKPEPTAEAPRPTADSKPKPAEEAPKPEPKAEPKAKADAKPSPRKTTFRRGSKED